MTPLPAAARFTAVAALALTLAGAAALAGGMPSDEGPEVVLDEVVVDETLVDDAEADPVEPALAAVHDASTPTVPPMTAIERDAVPPPVDPSDGKRDHR